MADYQRGFVSGWQAAQPKWINAPDHLPAANGTYTTVAEAQKDYCKYPKASIIVNTAEQWNHGHWFDADGKYWKVLYWAMPLEYTLPIGNASGKVA